MTHEKSTKLFSDLAALMGYKPEQKQPGKNVQKNNQKNKSKKKISKKGANKSASKKIVHKVAQKIKHPRVTIFDDDLTKTASGRKNDMTLTSKQVEEILANPDLLKVSNELTQKNASTQDVAEYNARLYRSDYGFVNKSDLPITLILGVDFGSTCSKVVARFPYETIGEKPEAIPALECAADENNPYYWRSEVFLDEDGQFSLIANKSSRHYYDLKIAFIKRAEEDSLTFSDLDVPVIAFIALLTKQACGWVAENHKTLSINDVEVELNFGFPVKSFETTASLEKFEKVLKIATHLIEQKREISFQNIRSAIDELVNKQIDLKTRVSVIPEIVAAVTGFANSSESMLGHYIIIDVGGLSIDYAFFSIRKYPGSGDINFGIASAGSKKHGVEILRNSGLEDINMQRLMMKHITEIIEEAFKKLAHDEFEWRAKDLKIFLTGGGRSLSAYKNVSHWNNRYVNNARFSRVTQLKDIHRFHGLNYELVKDRIPNRLVIAFGLSFSSLDFPDWYTPDQINPVQRSAVEDFTTSYIGPEQV